MGVEEAGFLRMLVLVPHRDVRLVLRKWSADLFAAGLEGAWSFPWVAPLALLKRVLSGAELKSLARGMGERDRCLLSVRVDNPISVLSIFHEPFFLFGATLNLELSAVFFEPVIDAIKSPFSPLLIGAGLLNEPMPDGIPAPPDIFFRAAALANMEYRLLPAGGGGSYVSEWRIGALHWLPRG